ncbi:tumor necrosis factor receptor superfamily member 14-like [Alosa pseudoharengus]|uniref:tumor necrosis factor receptor superfamily member 14-like n=1 Tax=Alosa pseudoharengus TaxID=34774 RepID=UPI003F89CC2D
MDLTEKSGVSLITITIITMFLNITSPPCGQQIQLQVLFCLIHLMQLSCACGPAEYQTGVDCCPMCGPGYCVHRHCTEYTSTTCVPCLPSTFTDQPNGLVSCRSCTVCDTGAGLRVKRVCSSTSDTLCEPLEGHYCIDPIKDGCRGAVEHTKCSPGQYINQNGTSSSDTVCGDCGNNTYSDGSFTSCRPHTQCPRGQQMIKAGTSSSNTECEETQLDLITIAIVPVAVTIFGAVAMVAKNNQAMTERKTDTLTNYKQIQVRQCQPNYNFSIC